MRVVLVHGGAGAWARGSDVLADARAACEVAAADGFAVLAGGGSALDAVEAAIRSLEDAPMLNAGRGSCRTSAGTVEMDALIMDGATLGLGAVAGVTRVRHPVSLAREVMQRTRHTLLVAAGAEAFADSIGFPRCDEAELIVEPPPAAASDTVGAVACDGAGHVAAATSTGGIPGKLPGRVGDSPLPGAGGYADDASAAASATGDGEALMKLVISKRAADLVAAGRSPQDACAAAMAELAARIDGAHGGLIAVDALGRVGIMFNTAAMPWAWASADRAASGTQPPEA
jgi:beta-aspartyl-peptidase (threonine type)